MEYGNMSVNAYACFVLCAIASCVHADEGVVLSLEGSSHEWAKDSMLFVRATLKNGSRETIEVPATLSAEFDTLRFEIREKSGDWIPITAIRQGSKAVSRKTRILEPQQTVSKIEILKLSARDRRIDFNAGAIRCTISFPGDREHIFFASDEFKVSVLAASPSAKSQEMFQCLSERLGRHTLLVRGEWHRFGKLASDNSLDPQARLLLSWLEAASQIRPDAELETRRGSVSACRSIAKKLHPMAQQYLALKLVYQAVSTKDFDMACEEALTLPKDSEERVTVEMMIHRFEHACADGKAIKQRLGAR
jgi:hypothetical protein